jgi:hypothetical protein
MLRRWFLNPAVTIDAWRTIKLRVRTGRVSLNSCANPRPVDFAEKSAMSNSKSDYLLKYASRPSQDEKPLKKKLVKKSTSGLRIIDSDYDWRKDSRGDHDDMDGAFVYLNCDSSAG